ncbi:MAG: anaerobic ribonucleoside-triphosphate reductase activating protein [Gammaproteobacteria bacterium]|nr:anaerobic ribonucleoside-triphosphate reductase activating protein [Gammaproteobacteria bacterium]
MSQHFQNTPQPERREITIGGITPLTTIDFPDALSAVIFCQGCPWRCRYCHNSTLVKRNTETRYRWKDILKKLGQRVGLLDAIVFSGGEPTLQPGLHDAIHDIKALGFKAGLHTAGCYPEKLEKLLPSLDWVGFDIKAPAEDYDQITGVSNSGDKAWQSLELLQNSNVDYEVRITVHDDLLPDDRLKTLLQRLSVMGIKNIALQHCQTDDSLDRDLGPNRIDWKHSSCIDYAQNHFEEVVLRLPS